MIFFDSAFLYAGIFPFSDNDVSRKLFDVEIRNERKNCFDLLLGKLRLMVRILIGFCWQINEFLMSDFLHNSNFISFRESFIFIDGVENSMKH